MKYVGLFSFLLLLIGISPVFASYEPPTIEEKSLFDKLLDQFEAVKAIKKDVSDVIQTFDKPMTNNLLCNSHDKNNQVIIIIKTRLAKFDENIVHQDLITGGSYTWHCSEIRQGKNVTLDCNNELRINPKIISSEDAQIDQKLHAIENLVILYHELLHGQLMIDAIKDSQLWRQEICNTESGDKIDYSFADADHKIINYMQTQFASDLVEKVGGKIITKEISADETKNGTFTIKVLSFTDYPAFQKNDARITLRTNNIYENSFFQVKNDVFLSGHLKNNTKSGTAWFYIFKNEKMQKIKTEPIPAWIKRTAGSWSIENTDESNFYLVINYFIEHNIVSSNYEKNSMSKIPQWIKKDVYFWFNDEIDDRTFVSSIQYLISTRVIL